MHKVGVCYIVFGMMRSDDDLDHRRVVDDEKDIDRSRDKDSSLEMESSFRWDINAYIDTYYRSDSSSSSQQQFRRGFRIVGASADDNFGHAVSNAGNCDDDNDDDER